MTQETLLMVFGAIVSAIFRYIPVLGEKFDALPDARKQQIMALALLIVAGAIFGLNCTTLFALPPELVVACDKTGAVELFKMFFLLVIGNQAVYPLIKR